MVWFNATPKSSRAYNFLAMHSLCLIFAATALAQAQDLGTARRLLRDGQERPVRQGVEACVKANSVKALELPLGVLAETNRRSLAAAHYRDMAWSGLIRITGKEARARVREELARSRDASVRQWCQSSSASTAIWISVTIAVIGAAGLRLP